MTKRKAEGTIFIDTNIYLRFYSSLESQLMKLLPSLLAAKGSICTTQQVVSEVRRRRLDIAAEYHQEVLKRLGMGKASLPEQLDADDARSRDWNESRRKLASDEEELTKQFRVIARETLNDVMLGRDPVSVALEEIFALARLPNADEIASARLRKELGNPPGKRADPLGDQLSWEQLLSTYNGTGLWIITGDSDFAIKFDGVMHLNAFLRAEIAERQGDAVEVYVFDSLAEGLKHFEKTIGAETRLPPESVLDDIAMKEKVVSDAVRISDELRVAVDYAAPEQVRQSIENLEAIRKGFIGMPDQLREALGIDAVEAIRKGFEPPDQVRQAIENLEAIRKGFIGIPDQLRQALGLDALEAIRKGFEPLNQVRQAIENLEAIRKGFIGMPDQLRQALGIDAVEAAKSGITGSKNKAGD